MLIGFDTRGIAILLRHLLLLLLLYDSRFKLGTGFCCGVERCCATQGLFVLTRGALLYSASSSSI